MQATFHAVCDEFDPLTTEEFAGLKASISANKGCKHHVLIWRDEKGKQWIMDGKHRVKACNELHLSYPYDIIGGPEDDAIKLARDLNEKRRHRPYGKRALDAAEESTATDGRKSGAKSKNPGNSLANESTVSKETVTTEVGNSDSEEPKTRAESASKHRVSVAAVNRGKAINEHGSEAIKKAVSEGKVKLADAESICRESHQAQDRAIELVLAGKAKSLKVAIKIKPDRYESLADDSKAKAKKLDLTDDQILALSKFDEETQLDLLDSVIAKRQTITEAIESGMVPDKTIEETIGEKNSEIESFCRQLMSFVEKECPQDEWLNDLGRRNTAMQKFKDGCTTLRTAKCHCACPSCDGEGCRSCHKTGRVPKATYEQLV